MPITKKWAFVSDYARAKVLYEEGGFYLDTDMELKTLFPNL
jgi:mannosyltransferase OCH1-like enzyme